MHMGVSSQGPGFAFIASGHCHSRTTEVIELQVVTKSCISTRVDFPFVAKEVGSEGSSEMCTSPLSSHVSG